MPCMQRRVGKRGCATITPLRLPRWAKRQSLPTPVAQVLNPVAAKVHGWLRTNAQPPPSVAIQLEPCCNEAQSTRSPPIPPLPRLGLEFRHNRQRKASLPKSWTIWSPLCRLPESNRSRGPPQAWRNSAGVHRSLCKHDWWSSQCHLRDSTPLLGVSSRVPPTNYRKLYTNKQVAVKNPVGKGTTADNRKSKHQNLMKYKGKVKQKPEQFL